MTRGCVTRDVGKGVSLKRYSKMSGNHSYWSHHETTVASDPQPSMQSNSMLSAAIGTTSSGHFFTTQTDGGGYPVQNGGFQVQQSNGGLPIQQTNCGFPVQQTNCVFPVQQANGGFHSVEQNGGFLHAQNVGFPAQYGGFPNEQLSVHHLSGSSPMVLSSNGHHQQIPMININGHHQQMISPDGQREQIRCSSPMMTKANEQQLQYSNLCAIMVSPSNSANSPMVHTVNEHQQQQHYVSLPARPASLIRRSSSASSNGRLCSHCGIDVRAISEQMETTQRKLELLQEKVEVDQALLDQEKKNFKRRLQAAKASVKKSQLDAANKERQRQLEWANLQKQTEATTQEKMIQQQQEYELKLLETEATASKHMRQQTEAIESLQDHVLQLQSDVDTAVAAHQEQQAVAELLRSQMTTTCQNAEQQERIEQLERDLDDKQVQMESLEMQLLELERERDASGLLRGSGGSTAVAVVSDLCCGQCQSLNRQISDAQLQIDTLQSRQALTDQKLSQERRKYEDLRNKMDSLEAIAGAHREQNDIRLKMAADLEGLQRQLNEARIGEQERISLRKLIEQKLIESQEENEELQEKVEALQKLNQSLLLQLEEEKCKAESAIAMTAATIRASEDSATVNVINVVGGAPPEAPTPSQKVKPTFLAIGNDNRKYVMEYEWHGSRFSGVYTGQLSVTTNNPDGDGTLRVDDGAVYNGEWHDGKPHGVGVWATIEGDLYCSADWRNGEKHGMTVDVLCDGCVYRGDYEHGKRHGQGVLTWPYGAHYTGQFIDDKRNGEGDYSYADGRCYTGNYKDDRPDGYGVLKAADGTILYDGMWQLGEFIGKR